MTIARVGYILLHLHNTLTKFYETHYKTILCACAIRGACSV